jgi:nuclear GTP-binding protein
MAKPFLKKKSKKLTTKTRCKIEKKVREHHRKVRREMRKSKKGSKRKEIVVPGKAPFKEQLLAEAEDLRQAKQDAKQARREQVKVLREAVRQQLKNKGRNDGKLEKLVAEAQQKQSTFEKKKAADKKDDGVREAHTKSDNSMKAYYTEVKKVIEAADVVIQVLDARDPLGSRCPQVETAVLSAGKRLVLLLNKIDLIPRDNVDAWLKYLRKELPTVAFKASTQEQASRLGFAGRDASGTSKCVGADILMRVLGNYCRNREIKTRISVGIVGFPNVGKSSVINSLRRGKCCNVGATPGVTRRMQEVDLDKSVRLLDSPGVVMLTGKDGNGRSQNHSVEVALRNAVRVESLEDPVTPVEAILNRCSKENLMLHYNIMEWDDVLEFLTLVAERMGRIKKGGVPDHTGAARKVLQDWNCGKIRYFTEPPADHTASSAHLSFAIIPELAKEFDVEADVGAGENLVIEAMPALSAAAASCVPSLGLTTGDFGEDAGAEGSKLQTDDGEGVTAMDTGTSTPAKKTGNVEEPSTGPSGDVEMRLAGNQQSGKVARKALKRRMKKRKRASKLGSQLADRMEVAFSTMNEEYDFQANFK